MRKWRALWLVAIAIVAVAALLIGMSSKLASKREGSAASAGQNGRERGERLSAGGATLPSGPSARPELAAESGPNDAELIKYLQDEFGPTIFHKHTQIKAIEKLMAYLMKFYPEDWRDRVHDFLKQIFPELADELYARFEKLVELNQWLAANRSELMQMDAKDRRGALWDARHQFFGEDAYQIWEVARRNEQILDSLDEIAESTDRSVGEKVELYVDAVKGAYGDKAEQFLQKRQTELMTSFLSVPAVQDDLHSLPPEVRKRELRHIRRAMGLDEEALRRWDALDEERDQVWEDGQRYMAAREKIVESYDGEERDRRVAALRDQIFGPEAEIIADEEEAGFYRFGHRRVFGRE